MFEKSISHAMISYVQIETLLLGNITWSCKPSWSPEVSVSQHQPKHFFSTSWRKQVLYPYQVGELPPCVMEFLYISFHPYIKEKSHQFLRFPKELQHLPNIRSSRGQRSLSPVSPISRWQKWYTIWCKKLWPTSASHKPSGWPRQGVKWHHLAHPFGAALAVELPGLQAPVFLFFGGMKRMKHHGQLHESI